MAHRRTCGRVIGGPEPALRLQCRGVVRDVVADEAGDEVVAVVVARLQAQGQRVARLGSGSLQQFRLQLALQEFVRIALIDEQRQRLACLPDQLDRVPGLPCLAIVAQVGAWEDEVRPLVERRVGEAAIAITRESNAAGESALGNLIADAQRAAMRSQIAFTNPGGIRDDLPAGPISASFSGP